jgi:hypothetical protein
MTKLKVTDERVREAYAKYHGNKAAASRSLGMSESGYKDRFNRLSDKIEVRENVVTQRKKGGQWVVETDGWRLRDIDDVKRELNVDAAVWRVKSFEHSNYDVTMKIRNPGEADRPFTVQNVRLKVVFERVVPEVVENAVDRLLARLEGKSPKPPKIKRLKLGQKSGRNALEIALMDPHYGMRTFRPASDAEWSPEFCAQMVMESLEEIIELAAPFGPFEEIVLPMGNDFFHSDTIWQETTQGTGQPEADAYYNTFVTGEALAIRIVDRVKEIAPVRMYFIPGNHDRTTSFMLGRVLQAYYKNDPDVAVDATPSPYKFHEYGCNLIGYEHGHSVAAIRLAALMANEAPDAWARTKNGYREWHLGDQHRKGSAKPSMMEEQGVSIEYLPSITAPNEWHRLKGFNWQKRGTMAFVWNFTRGPLARLQVNVDRYLNRLMGR